MADSVVTVMISCVQRHEARALTIPQLEAAGYPPEVFLSPCNPAGAEGNTLVSREAMEWAATQDASVLFVEDDIDLAPDFAWHATVAAGLDAVTYLYLNDSSTRLGMHVGKVVTMSIMERQVIKRGAYAIQKRAALFGTQCVMIPKRLVNDMLHVLHEPHPKNASPWDGRLHTWTRRNTHEPIYLMLPNPVQHRMDRTMRAPARQEMRSFSFGCPWEDADDPIIAKAPRGRSPHAVAARQAALRAWRAAQAEQRARSMKHEQ